VLGKSGWPHWVRAGFTQEFYPQGLLAWGHYRVLSLFLLPDFVRFGICLAGTAMWSLARSTTLL